MAPSGWASPSQTTLLTSLVPEYERCQVHKRYKPFWTMLYARFLEHSPLIDTLYPGRTVQDLSVEEMGVYTLALEKLQQRLREWFRWRCNVRSRKVAVGIPKKILKSIYSPRTRGPKAYEAYAKLYPEEVRQAQEERGEGGVGSGKNGLQSWHTVCKELLSKASEENLRAIDDYVESMAQDSKLLLSEDKPKDPKRYLQILPAILKAAIEPAVRKVDLMALVTLVGPVPESNGKISAWTLQFGDKEDTPLFSSSWVDHDRVYVEAVARFAKHHLFPSSTTSSSKKTDSVMPEASPSTVAETTEVPVEVEASADEKEETDGQEPAHSVSSAHEDASFKSLMPGVAPNRSLSAGSDLTQVSSSHENASFKSLMPRVAPNRSPSAGSDLTRDTGDSDDEVDQGPGLRLPSPPAFGDYSPQSVFLGSADDNEANSIEASLDLYRSLRLGNNNNCIQGYQSQDLSYDNAGAGLITMSPDPYEGDENGLFRGMGLSLPSDPRARRFVETPGYYLTQKESLDWASPRYLTSTSAEPRGIATSQTIPTPLRSYISRPPSATPTFESRPMTNPDQSVPIAAGGTELTQQRTPGFALESLPYTQRVVRPRSVTDNHSEEPMVPFMASQPLGSKYHSSWPFPTPPPKLFVPAGSQLLKPNAEPIAVAAASPLPEPISVSAASQLHQPDAEPIAASAPSSLPAFASFRAFPASCRANRHFRAFSPTSCRAHDHFRSSCGFFWTCFSQFDFYQDLPTANCRALSNCRTGDHRHLLHHPLTTSTSPEGAQTPPPPVSNVRTGVCSTSSNGQPAPVTLPSATANASPVTCSANVNASPADSTNTEASMAPPRGSDLPVSSVRRSERASVPSKTRERLQQIGTNQLSYPTPAKPKDDPLTPPGWFNLATSDLRDPKLGGEWVSLVDKWASLERSLGYGKMSKGPMPVKGRPEEWTKWTNRSAHGARNHSRPPFIDDPTDIGISITKWWKDMQPQFRASQGPLPSPTWEDPAAVGDVWASIRKSGPNGTLPLIMLLLWWGRAAEPGPESFREDSRDAWKAMVADVSQCFDVLASTNPSQRDKRGLDDPTPPPTDLSKKLDLDRLLLESPGCDKRQKFEVNPGEMRLGDNPPGVKFSALSGKADSNEDVGGRAQGSDLIIWSRWAVDVSVVQGWVHGLFSVVHGWAHALVFIVQEVGCMDFLTFPLCKGWVHGLLDISIVQGRVHRCLDVSVVQGRVHRCLDVSVVQGWVHGLVECGRHLCPCSLTVQVLLCMNAPIALLTRESEARALCIPLSTVIVACSTTTVSVTLESRAPNQSHLPGGAPHAVMPETDMGDFEGPHIIFCAGIAAWVDAQRGVIGSAI
ncbi:hypothetical protein DFP72DRAFT_849696 [Ephemerocybe angulata]|uniref:Uncharacterized protein n=1 Tax=Ephemerocybe angulata TaxID=980116 RepID=A0A8H6HTK0_9AGAR|nr:hypothetical protein DFP72DRAFT_849696 [Tulosesus angulatus]